MSIQQELLGTALLTRIRLLRQELLGKEGLLFLSVQNLFAQSLTYLFPNKIKKAPSSIVHTEAQRHNPSFSCALLVRPMNDPLTDIRGGEALKK